ncbi:MAG: hypothetical protein RLY50_1257, partial [Actinomycetota bacterium]
ARTDAPRYLGALVPVASIAAALLLGAVFLLATGHDPIEAFREMLRGGFTSFYGITDTLGLSTVLILTGVAAAFAFQMNLYNIGGEGQLYLGMIGGAWAGLAFGDRLPSAIAVPVVLLAGALFGALWIVIPSIVRSRLGTSEIVTTLLLTYVAVNLMNYFIYTRSSFFRDESTAGFPQGRPLPESSTVDSFGSTQVYPTLIVAVVVALLLFWIVKRTEFGYRIQVLADSPRAARYAGVSAQGTTLAVMMISGALAGLAGSALIVGPFGKLDISITAMGYGYAGIVVAALARNNFAAIILTAILFAGLRTGGDKLRITSDIPEHIGVMLQGAVLLFALGGEIFRRYRLRIVRRQEAAAA